MKKRGTKHKKIIDAAVKVIAIHGYHQAQVAKIAREAGVADGTIYLYFKSKEDILISLFEEKMGEFVEKIKKEIEGKQNITSKLLTLIENHFSLMQKDYEFAIVTQLELRQTNSALRSEIGKILKPYLNLMDELVQEGVDQAIFTPSLNVKLARQMIFGTMDDVVTNWVMNDFKYDLASLANPVQQLLLNGFCNRSS